MKNYKKKIIYSKADNFGANFPISGKLQIVNSFKDLKNVKKGHILFLNGLKFKFDSLNIIINLINKGVTSFISTDISKTDHGCIAAKELGINFYQIKGNINKIFLHENKIITLKDCNIYSGKHNFKKPRISLKKIDTKHSLKLNIGFPSNLIYKNFINVSDGVGFSRVEFLLSKILNNIHPHKYTEFVGIKNFTDEIANHIRPLLKILKKQNKEFWLRTDDFSVEQLIKMEFGKNYEIEEKISSTGYRGIRRSINNKKIVTPVLLALKKLHKEGFHNIGLFPPMTNSIFEYKKWLTLLSNYNLINLKKGLMVETPRSALMIEEFLKDIKFVIFGTNDLTSFLLAVDRNNLNIREMFNELDSVVIKVIGDVIKKCKLNNIETYITGSISENKNLLKKFFSYGLTGVTINPDINSINKVKQIIFDLEKKN